jgi:hypothetical protein
MNYAVTISPTDFRDYAKVLGWVSVQEAIADRLFVLNHAAHKFRQIVIPMDADRPDYNDAVRVAIEKMAETEEKPYQFVENNLLEVGSDTIRFGVSTMRNLENGLPFHYAVQAVNGVENALRAAACSEVQKQPFHPKMKRSEAQKLVESAQMRHTETGSFVLKVACPLDAIQVEKSQQDVLNFEATSIPFVRRAIVGMNLAIIELVDALESDKLAELVEKTKKEGASPLSANLCESLMSFQDDTSKANLDFSVAWSARIELPAPRLREKVKIQWDYFSRIEQVATSLRPIQPPKEQPFIGLVDELKGDLGVGETREGEVVLSLLVDGESIKAKANLTAEQHKIAYQAYGKGKTYIKIAGLLNPGNQPRKLTDIKEFSLV